MNATIKRLALTCIFLIMITLSLCANGSAQSAYVNTRFGFRLTLPSGWKQISHPEAALVLQEIPGSNALIFPGHKETTQEFLDRARKSLSDANAPRFLPVFTVMARLAGNLTLAQYAAQTRANAARTSTFRIIGEVPSMFKGTPAIVRTVRTFIPGEPIRQSQEIISLHRGALFAISISASVDKHKHYAALMDRILVGFNWL